MRSPSPATVAWGKTAIYKIYPYSKTDSKSLESSKGTVLLKKQQPGAMHFLITSYTLFNPWCTHKAD